MLYMPGGYGTCVDFADNMGALVSAFAAAGKVVCTVCHGPNSLVNATNADGTPLVKGKKVAYLPTYLPTCIPTYLPTY